MFFPRRKTKKPMTRSRAQVCKGWVLYRGALLVRSRFRIGEDQFIGKFAATARNRKMKKIFFPRYNLKMGMLSLSLSSVVAIQKVVRLRGSSRDSCNRNWRKTSSLRSTNTCTARVPAMYVVSGKHVLLVVRGEVRKRQK